MEENKRRPLEREGHLSLFLSLRAKRASSAGLTSLFSPGHLINESKAELCPHYSMTELSSVEARAG
ncbi:MAG: hypothetical protein WCT10_05625, partial [Patescibacteria group bacterium]